MSGGFYVVNQPHADELRFGPPEVVIIGATEPNGLAEATDGYTISDDWRVLAISPVTAGYQQQLMITLIVQRHTDPNGGNGGAE